MNMKMILIKFLTMAIVGLTLVSNSWSTSLSDLVKVQGLQAGFVGLAYDKEEDKIYLKIDNLGEPFIYQSSLPAGIGSNDIGLDRGQLGETRLVKFEIAGKKLFLRQLPTDFVANTDNPLEASALAQAFASSILWGFEIVDRGTDKGKSWVLVDASEFVLQDIHGVGRRLETAKQGKSYQVDSSRSALNLSASKAFPDNTELQATITLTGSEPGSYLKSTVPNPRAVTVTMQHSFVRLPEPGYQARDYAPKSGYWAVGYWDYAQAINKNIEQRFIGRHRLEKKDPTAAMSEAVEPIVYYLDPGVPEPVKSALLDGALWWNEAFEAVGYKDAFQVKMLPADADPMDIRYNVIQWVHRSTRGWSYGSSVVDPRTGEILKGHVTLGSLRVRQDYLIAQGMMAPFNENEQDAALMDLALARIRQLSAHEVGHTLGINHNFAASNYGRESVMDYPHPLFELDPNDNSRVIAPNAYAVGLGKWDKAAIAYGYQQFGSAERERAGLKKIIQQSDEQGLLYITDADARSPGSPHADASLWDNGRDAIDELQRMIAVRAAAIANFGSANLKVGQNWSDLEELFVPVYYSTRYQIEAAAKWLGGSRYDYGTKDPGENAPVLNIVKGEDQHRALEALVETLKPEYLAIEDNLAALFVPKVAEIYRSRESAPSDTGVSFDSVKVAAASARHTLSVLLHPHRLARIHQQAARDQSQLSIRSMGALLHDSLVASRQQNPWHNTIQQQVTDLLISNYLNIVSDAKIPSLVRADVFDVLQRELRYFESRSKRNSASDGGFYAYQVERIQARIDKGLNEPLKIELPTMPPGSPI